MLLKDISWWRSAFLSPAYTVTQDDDVPPSRWTATYEAALFLGLEDPIVKAAQACGVTSGRMFAHLFVERPNGSPRVRHPPCRCTLWEFPDLPCAPSKDAVFDDTELARRRWCRQGRAPQALLALSEVTI